jgi:hypothetical protein
MKSEGVVGYFNELFQFLLSLLKTLILVQIDFLVFEGLIQAFGGSIIPRLDNRNLHPTALCWFIKGSKQVSLWGDYKK